MADGGRPAEALQAGDLAHRYLWGPAVDQILAGSTDYASPRPDRWATAHPEPIRTHRVEERHDRSCAQPFRRAHRRPNPT